ncbi:hypothetical protein J6590_101732, partial [Homalodisca vitripennis]
MPWFVESHVQLVLSTESHIVPRLTTWLTNNSIPLYNTRDTNALTGPYNGYSQIHTTTQLPPTVEKLSPATSWKAVCGIPSQGSKFSF